jgi:phosphotransferase system enzyme I (PtsI)
MSITITAGIIASPGIKMGKAYVIQGNKLNIPQFTLREDELELELARFGRAIEKTKREIMEIQQQIARSLSDEMSDIFMSHLMVLEDPVVVQRAREKIIKERKNAEWAINDISIELIKSLDKIEDEYMRERIIDISDINKRVISNLQNSQTSSLADITDEVIVFAPDLTPSETAIINKNLIMAFVTDQGGKTSHTAIMARAMSIPAIVGTKNITSTVKNGDMVIVDALNNRIIINPTEDEIREFNQHQREFRELELELSKLTTLPAQTVDREEVFIYGNIEIPEEMQVIHDHGAQGIGLFRSEFLFLGKTLPDEERQFQEYRKVAEYFSPHPVTIRTLDVGGDKINSYSGFLKERNPFLGCRAIRFSLENEEMFRVQLRAILRASHYGNIQLMFPMITTLEEFQRAKSITLEIKEDLIRQKIPFDENIPMGIMIEVPSAAINADILAREADFFSVGTNDLVQYILAVDRISEKIAYLYNPLNLAVLRMLKHIVDTSRDHDIPISICGEIAGEPQYTMVLLGLGFRRLSMSPTYMFQVKRLVRSVTIAECEELTSRLFSLTGTQEIENLVRESFKDKYKEILF